MEYKNIETRLINKTARGCQGSHKLGQLEDIFSFCASTSFCLRNMKPKTGFVSVPSSLWAVITQKSYKLSAARRPNCERSNAPIFTIRVLGAMLILLRLFARNFIFGAEANISARAEVRHVIATKFQPGWSSWNFSPGWNLPCNRALKMKLSITWRGIQPGAQFSPAKRAWKSEKVSCNPNKISARPEIRHVKCHRAFRGELLNATALNPIKSIKPINNIKKRKTSRKHIKRIIIQSRHKRNWVDASFYDEHGSPE